MTAKEIGKQKIKEYFVIYFFQICKFLVAKLSKYGSPSVSNCLKGIVSIRQAPKEIGLHEFYFCDLSNDNKPVHLKENCQMS